MKLCTATAADIKQRCGERMNFEFAEMGASVVEVTKSSAKERDLERRMKKLTL